MPHYRGSTMKITANVSTGKSFTELMQATIAKAAGLLVGCVVVFATEATVHALAGVEGTFEYAIDAPWRMEPDKQMQYGAIPIQISIHDAMFAGLDNDPAGVPTTLEDIISVT